MDERYHDENGNFKEGNPGGPGRPPGLRNKYTLAKEAVLNALLARIDELDTESMNNILKFVSTTSPKEQKIEVDGPINVRWLKPGEASGEDD